MGMSIAEWEHFFNRLGVGELNRIADSIRYLEQFPEFRENFSWTCLFSLARIAENVATQKSRCSTCRGDGVVRIWTEEGADVDDCPDCGGTGWRE